MRNTEHVAAAGTQRSMRLIGPARAKLLLFTGRRLDGEQAVAWGLAEVLADDPVQARLLLLRSVSGALAVAWTAAGLECYEHLSPPPETVSYTMHASEVQ